MKNYSHTLIASLPEISALAILKDEENQHFKQHLKLADTALVDNLVAKINTSVETEIDCKQCGNCCKSLMIVVEEEEATIMATATQQTRAAFDEQYLEKGSNGMMLMNTIPCHFLADNQCTIYTSRPSGCKEFPAMHLPFFTERLFTTFMHYNRCPIIFNVVEILKKEVGFC